jgi:glycine/D-amino acid oxidase-like deaminating enzyme/nitrite reductase/ring-hydroxylating ferredoxin subunit
MELPQEKPHSIWQKIERPIFPVLLEDVAADVCVVGAGISGLTTAYLLLKEGRNVVVIDREQLLGEHESGLTSAHLSNALDDRYSYLHRLHGEQGARLAAESHTMAIDEIERICRDEDIHCDFERVPGYLFLGPEHDEDFLRDEMKAARAAGLFDVEFLSRSPISLFDTGPCLKFQNQAQFHPLKYLIGLSLAVQRAGGRIFLQTAATHIEGGHPARVHTALGHKILCEDIVVATNVPFNDKLIMQTKNAAYRTYTVGVEIPWGHFPPALLWDTSDPYHYIRLVRDNNTLKDVLIVGGADHRVGHEHDPEHRFSELTEWIGTRLNLDEPVTERWSGQIIEPVDGMAYIGRNPNDADNVYIVTGDSGNGLTHGTIAGMLLRDLILNRENPWTDLYDPARLNFKGLGTYLKEVMSSTVPYSDWLKGSDVESVDEIEPGEGAVIRDGLRKLAVYRDTFGNTHCMSAMCTHLGGVVRWNSAEKTWDCPCHGSRFSRYGEVLNPPAPLVLKPAELPGIDKADRAAPPPGIRVNDLPTLSP